MREKMFIQNTNLPGDLE